MDVENAVVIDRNGLKITMEKLEVRYDAAIRRWEIYTKGRWICTCESEDIALIIVKALEFKWKCDNGG